ncbi:polymer-forming cytoskeletal protein [Candidatus Haliotispira prima]|uniref:Polymer-forming cytoskeletal protein n=1 Tax=Candidatus Haliotispira prima TaxID=3034016 RepID=A0ABY8MGI8_9SPIO|nr:polymer-forming cytoskeletal protein [Candidatus Haliotispira prima]
MAKFRIGNSLQKGKIAGAFNSTLGAASGGLPGMEPGTQSPGSSRIAEGAYVRGELAFSGDLYFSGKLEGSIEAQKGNLELSGRGEVYGNVHCRVMDCYGQVFGNIEAEGKSILRNNCKLIGDIVTQNLSIQNGAQISGSCKMLGDKADTDFFSMPIDTLRKHLKSGKPAK